jgi:hypothetical protein
MMLFTYPALAQAPQPGSAGAGPAEAKTQLKADPFPEPPFPATVPEKKQFTVEYVYRYNQRLYTPQVPLANVARTAAKETTPEGTATAMISAMQSLDYDWWLSLWDAQSHNLLAQEAKTMQHDAAFWQQFWKRSVVGTPVTFVKRLEAQKYVIVELRLGAAPAPGARDYLMPVILKQEANRWVLTREIDSAGFFPGAGTGQATLSSPAGFVPTTEFGGAVSRYQQAQGDFFRDQPGGAETSTRLVW